MPSALNTPDLRPTAVGLTPLSNGQAFNHLKRTLSQDAESMNGDGDADANGRRSKRLKKGKRTLHACRILQPPFRLSSEQGCVAANPCRVQARLIVRRTNHWPPNTANNPTADAVPTVAGSHMTQPRQSTPGRPPYPRVRQPEERPGDVSCSVVHSFVA